MPYQTIKSQKLFAQAQARFAGGVGSGTRSPASGWVPSPVYVDRGEGSHLWDADGNRYVDYLMAGGPLILGHRPKAVIDRVCQVIQERGSMFALAHDLEIEAAMKVCQLLPSVEKVRFDNSGTSAVQRAVRLARAYTGKTKIVRFEGHYHGWSDQMHWSNRPPLEAAGRRNAPRAVPNSNGIPEVLGKTLIVLPWNDIDLLEKTIQARKHEIACVITEPILGNLGGLLPKPGYLKAMRQLTADNDVVLIFDEVLTGFRVAPECAQGKFSLLPDLTTLAKAMAGGFPAAAVGGRAEIMDLISSGEVMYGGTYNSSPIVTSAVIATLSELSQPGVFQKMEKLGVDLANGLVELAQRAGFPACWSGVGSMFQLWFCDESQLPYDYRSAVQVLKSSPYAKFWEGLMKRGVLVQPRQDNLFLLSTTHSEEDIQLTLQVAKETFKEMKALQPPVPGK
ncbi:MAG: glutamate-1-semialdehyde 2,1-aminomutase [Anaerolineales bacterium]|nr:glutamate-1-semialdehyde 2,1-aminomutase [Anaerolineales bacterium]